MNEKAETETTRTDELTLKHGHSSLPADMCYSEMKLFARSLERELNEALDANKRANGLIGSTAEECKNVIQKLESQLTALKAENAELVKDKERFRKYLLQDIENSDRVGSVGYAEATREILKKFNILFKSTAYKPKNKKRIFKNKQKK